MSLSVLDDSDSSDVVSSDKKTKVSSIELDMVNNLSSSQIQFQGVVHLDGWVRVSDSSSIMCNDVWDLVRSDALGLNSDQLVSSFFWLDVLENESSCSVS